MTDRERSPGVDRESTGEPVEPGTVRQPASDEAEDEGYDEGAGDRISPEDTREDGPETPEETRQVPPSSTRHLPEDMPPE
ncbi:hypothetical protein DFQ14_102245 [Halopolyspora algeriensis]|uniref:Uncharacterized protein n=1 Tax=Halopolyspora algeriensis TaxID=1500506 RepID=A0A368VVS6_9ACTN|nr:hypothetical protein [Halopolyspora algeriensis]RCW45943.1 hypothetical protein DFQ14_102245 [Halopolyspora algeriensis]TQM55356.1 hypothetical protein FHU43_0119 [Halopolyspora algeriensis]